MNEHEKNNIANENFYTKLNCLRLFTQGHISLNVLANETGISLEDLTAYLKGYPDYSLEEITEHIIQEEAKLDKFYEQLDYEWEKELSKFTDDKKNNIRKHYFSSDNSIDLLYFGGFVNMLWLLENNYLGIDDTAQMLEVSERMLIPYLRHQQKAPEDLVFTRYYLADKILKINKLQHPNKWNQD